MKNIISVIFLVLLFGGASVYFLVSGASVLINKASTVGLNAGALSIEDGEYVSMQAAECSDYFLQIDHSVNYIHTHYTRFYLVPANADGSVLIAVEAGESMFDELDNLADGVSKFVPVDGVVKPLDSSTRQTVQGIQETMYATYDDEAPIISMFYIDMTADITAVQYILCGLAIPGIVLLGWLAIKLKTGRSIFGKLIIIPVLALLLYLLYFFMVVV